MDISLHPVFFGIVLAAGACAAALVGTFSGFGTATIMMPVLVLLLGFDVKTTLMIVAVFHGLTGVMKVFQFWPDIQWRTVGSFGLAAGLMSIPGASLAIYMPNALLLAGLGIFLSLYGLSGIRQQGWLAVSPGKSWPPVAGGGLSGFVSGLLGLGGALRNVFLTSSGLSKEKFVATTAMVGLLIDLCRVPVYGYGFNTMNSQYWVWWALMLVGGFAGVIFARVWLKRLTVQQFEQILYWTLLVFGIYCVEKGVRMMWVPG